MVQFASYLRRVLAKARLIFSRINDRRERYHDELPEVGGTPLCGLNGDVWPDRVWFSGCFVLNGVSISSLSILNRVSLHDLMA